MLHYNPNMQYGDFSSIYDFLMRSVDYDAWARYIVDLMPNKCGVLLECACGTGEITRRLHRYFESIIATDISDDMLCIAAEKCRNAGITQKEIRFANMDMRNIKLHKPVDCVVCCCDGVNYLTCKAYAESFFASAYAALKQGGALLFDISSRYKLESILGCSTFAENEDEASYIWQNNYDERSKLLEMSLTFFKRVGDMYRRFDETHIQRAHSVREISAWLNNAGFECSAYNFLSRTPPRENSERIQFVAIKK